MKFVDFKEKLDEYWSVLAEENEGHPFIIDMELNHASIEVYVDVKGGSRKYVSFYVKDICGNELYYEEVKYRSSSAGFFDEVDYVAEQMFHYISNMEEVLVYSDLAEDR